jgi:septation ring formation regulator
MVYVIGTIVLLLCFFLAGYVMRKKHYKEIDRLESWKIDLLNQPVPDELSKVKQLNMTGQTEDLFDRWRKEWDEIAATELPDLEELLFDSEEYIDKYRFNKAKEIQLRISTILSETEEKINNILTELNELVGSEQKNRFEIEELQAMYRESRKTLLAHNHTFGSAVKGLENQLDEIVTKFQEFEDKTENGNYLEAREVVLTIKARLDKMNAAMVMIPNMLQECQSGLPAQIAELKAGYQEMIDQTFHLEHLQFESETARLEEELTTLLTQLERIETEEVMLGIENVNDCIDGLYEHLEKEVHAKHFIQKNDAKTKELLEEVVQNNKKLQQETELVQQTYHLSEKDLEVNRTADKQVRLLVERYGQLLHRLQNQQEFAQSILSEELNEIHGSILQLLEEQKKYSETLQALRKDEVVAREKIQEMTLKVGETIRIVTKSNIPGLPHDYHYLLEDAEESIQTVLMKLGEKPLDIPTIHHYLDQSVQVVEKLVNTTTEMMENVVLAEKVIQYGNRYRSRYPSVARGLLEAELAFRTFDYKTALEHAATTINQVEPGAIKKIEEMLKEVEIEVLI